MVEEQIGSMYVDIGLNDTKFTQGSKNIYNKMQLLNSQLKLSKTQFGNLGNSIDGLKSAHDTLGKSYILQGKYVTSLKKKYDDLVEAHGATSKQALEAGKKLNDAQSYYVNLGKKIESTAEKIDDLENKWKIAGRGVTTFGNKVSDTGNKMSDFGKNMVLGVTLPLAGLATAGVKTALSIQKSQGKIQASLGLTKDEAKKVEQAGRELWKDGWGENLTGVNEAIKNTKANLQKLDGKELQQATKEALIFENVFGEDIQQSTRSAKTLMENFGGTSTKAFDYMTVAMQKGGNFSEELLDTINEYSPQFKSAGFSMEEMFNTLLSGASKGVWNLDKTADSVAEFSKRAVDGSKTTASGFSSVGLNADEMAEKMAEGGDSAKGAFMTTVAAISSMEDPLEQQQAGVSLFGTQWEDVKKEVIGALDPTVNMLGDVEGATEKAGKAVQDNLGTRATKELRKLGTALMPFAEMLLEEAVPAIEDTAKHVEKFTDWMEGLDPASKKAILAIGLVALAFAPVTLAVGSVITGVGKISGALGTGMKWMGKYRSSTKLTTASITTMGTQATIASTKVGKAGTTIGKAGKGMGAVQGGAMAAGTGLSMMGGKWGTVAGIATMFLPEIIKGGKGLVSYGKNAVKTGGGLAGMGGKVFGAVKSVKNLGSVLAIARGGLAAFGGPVGLAVTGVMLLAQGGYKLYKHLKEESIPAITDFGDKVSDSTTKAVLGYKELNEDATAELNTMAADGQVVTQKMADNLVGTFGKMGDTIKTSLKKDFDDSKKNMESLFTGSVLTDEYQKELLGKIDKANSEKIKKIEKFEARVKEITDKAVKEKRETSEVEKAEINAINKQMMDMAVKTLSEGQVEQQAIMEKLRTNSSSITARTAAKTVADSKKAKDGTIKEANKKYDGTIAAIIRERDETGSISAEEADTLIAEAKRQRDGSVKKAKEMHKGVVAESQKQAKGHIDDVDWETGKVLTGWDKMQNGIKKAVDWVRGIFGKGKTDSTPSLTSNKSVAKKPIPMMATGTPDGTHAGGPAIISEKGRELVHEPGVGTYLSGNNGAELVNLRRGTSVLPNHHTEKLLKSYNFPAYAKGTDDDHFDFITKGLLKGGKWVLGKAFDKFGVKNEDLPELSTISSKALFGNPVSNFLNTGAKWAKDLIDSFGGIGGVGGGKAPNIKGGASAWRGQIQKAAAVMRESLSSYELNGIIAQIQRESGGNQKITQSSAVVDINTLSGNPARGLLQYIPQTFNAYKMKGANNIYSGYDQLLAFFNNTTWRRDLPYGKRGWGPRGGRKYATGGEINYRQMAELGENGWKEWVLTSEPKYKESNLAMWEDAGNSMGVPKSVTSSAVSTATGNGEGKQEKLLKQIDNGIQKLAEVISSSDKVVQIVMNDRVVVEALFPLIDEKFGKGLRKVR